MSVFQVNCQSYDEDNKQKKITISSVAGDCYIVSAKCPLDTRRRGFRDGYRNYFVMFPRSKSISIVAFVTHLRGGGEDYFIPFIASIDWAEDGTANIDTKKPWQPSEKRPCVLEQNPEREWEFYLELRADGEIFTSIPIPGARHVRNPDLILEAAGDPSVSLDAIRAAAKEAEAKVSELEDFRQALLKTLEQLEKTEKKLRDAKNMFDRLSSKSYTNAYKNSQELEEVQNGLNTLKGKFEELSCYIKNVWWGHYSWLRLLMLFFSKERQRIWNLANYEDDK